MNVVYIAGPFRGAHHWEIAENIRRAERCALEVWKRGAVAICPHLNTAHFQGTCPDETWLRGDIELVNRSDAVYMIEGWANSVGATAEKHVAEDLQIPILYSVFDLEIFLLVGENFREWWKMVAPHSSGVVDHA